MTEINYLITLSYALFTAVTEDIMNLQILAFAIYFALILRIGIFFFFKDKRGGEKEYFLGGRSMGPWVTAMSAQASDMSGWLLMGFPGSILAFGMGQMWIGIGLAIGTIANWLIVARASSPILKRG